MIHHLFYQHNVQQFFIRHVDKYAGVIVPLSIAKSFPSGTYGFIRALLAKDRTKQFALDPRSALFQHAWNRSYVRDPHRRMAAVFGGPFVTHGLGRALLPDDLLANRSYEQVTKECLEYQLGFRTLKEEQRKLEKYRKLLGIDAIPEIQNPQRFIPPYFQFSSMNDPWYEVNDCCLRYAASLVPVNQLCPVVHFSSWSKVGDWAGLAGAFTQLGTRSLFLYPNDFKEHEASETELRAYAHCVKSLTALKLNPQALHGGYFAILLGKLGLDGFGNGIGYGEWRDSGYHRGGTAEVRIYIPKLHRFLDPARAQALVSQNVEYFTSDSDLLAEYALAQKPLAQVESQEALDHFMECRLQELNFVRSATLEQLIAELQETIRFLGAVGVLEHEQYGTSLAKWVRVLSAE